MVCCPGGRPIRDAVEQRSTPRIRHAQWRQARWAVEVHLDLFIVASWDLSPFGVSCRDRRRHRGSAALLGALPDASHPRWLAGRGLAGAAPGIIAAPTPRTPRTSASPPSTRCSTSRSPCGNGPGDLAADQAFEPSDLDAGPDDLQPSARLTESFGTNVPGRHARDETQ
jgi:hypothetical protein